MNSRPSSPAADFTSLAALTVSPSRAFECPFTIRRHAASRSALKSACSISLAGPFVTANISTARAPGTSLDHPCNFGEFGSISPRVGLSRMVNPSGSSTVNPSPLNAFHSAGRSPPTWVPASVILIESR